MVFVNTNDLKHILDQIRIAEQHAAGTPLTELVASPQLAHGLRLVDGSLNNLTEGRERFGAADEVMPRLLNSTFLTQPDSEHLADANPRAPQAGPTSYTQTSGSVYDADPRVISNLVADQTLANPAAIAWGLAHSGLTGQEKLTVANEISTAFKALQDAQAAATDVDAAIALQRATLTEAAQAADSALEAARADVADKDAAKTLADNAVTQAAGELETAAQALVAAQNSGDVAPALAALQDAQAAHQDAVAIHDDLTEQLTAAEQTAAGALTARNDKQEEIATLELARDAAAEALQLAQTELDTARNTFNAMTEPTGLVQAQEDVNTALADVATAEGDLEDVQGRLAQARTDLSGLETDLSAETTKVGDLRTALEGAQTLAGQTQTAMEQAQQAYDAEAAEASTARADFLDKFSTWMSSRSPADFADMVIASGVWTAEADQADAAETALQNAQSADTMADADVVTKQEALNAAEQQVATLTEQRDAAQGLVNSLEAEEGIDQTALTNANTALSDAQDALGLAEQEAAAYLEAQKAVTTHEGLVQTAETRATGAANTLSAANTALAGLETSLENANGEVMRLTGETNQAAQDVATEASRVEDAQQEYSVAQAASAGIGVALTNVAAATQKLSAAETAAATAASELTQAQNMEAEADTTLGNINAALAALDAPEARDTAIAAAELAATEAQTSLDTLLTTHGIEMDGNNVRIYDVTPDEGLSAPYNSWMTLFGQFFDHGLDLINKGGSGTVYIPLQPDDPLYVEGSPTNFMVLTRATNQPGPDGVLGTADDIREHANKTTPWVDQNQTYTSHPSHQVFLREYDLNGDGQPVSNGYLLHGQNGGMATWGDVKAQAATKLGIQLNDGDVLDGPLLATDPYGNFIPGANGLPQLVIMNPDYVEGGNEPVHLLVEGNLADPVDTSQALRNGHAFLEDIAHNAAPGTYVVDRFTGETAVKQADADTETGNAIIPNQFGQNETYDNELLDRHFIAGDGRGNENFGLTAVHHIFHTEHNRQTAEMKQTILDSGELDFINEWLVTPIDETGLAAVTSPDDLEWQGERLFQSAKFATEMQYQHLAFEEFGRRVQPQIAPFMVNSSLEVDPAIFAEFAHVVYRFGHSMLTENVHTMDANGVNTEVGLIEAFLNPVAYDQDGAITADQAAGAVARGMSRETGSNIDEFITSALRDNLVGLPLDLAALNIARGRDTGVPSLNAAREEFYSATGSEFLKPYDSWGDYAANLKNPASIVNYIAAYGAHDTITAATSVADKRAAAMDLVLGGEGAPEDRLDFVHGTGAWAEAETGINDVEFWIGGLAESIMPFGGMLGSTFGFVFQHQMENLQNGDRFYYLSRTNGMNMIGELENNSFASMIMRNTDIKDGGAHIPADIFASMEYILEVDKSVQAIEDPVSTDVDPFLAGMGTSLVERETATVDAPLVDGQLEYDNKLQFNGGEHVVLGGTDQRDILVGGLGDDALWGGDGNDLLIGGSGVNTFRGGAGDDIIKDGDDISFLHGEDGNDVISAGGGAAELIFGGRGDDAIIMGADDAKHAFAGMGNDFVLGGAGSDIVDGGEGDDWIEGGDGFDFLFGDNNDNLGGSRVQGHDVLWGGANDNDLHGESGDDILIQGEGTHVNLAEFGYDWIAHKNANSGAEIDLTDRVVTEQAEFFADRYIDAEAVSGTHHDDLIWGDNRTGEAAPLDGFLLDNEETLFMNELTQEGVDRIDGLRDFLGNLMGVNPNDLFLGGNILLGGGGSDVIQGRGGDDVIDGDLMLNVRISIRDANDPSVEIQSIDSLQEILPQLLDGSISPTQLQITREILDEGQEGDVDVAVYYDVRDNYSIRSNPDGSVIVSHINVTPGPNPIDPINGDQNPINGDGTDRLTNVEILRFADQEIDLRVTPPASGIIEGTPANDEIQGSPGTDVIFGAAGNDQINGLGGNDVIAGQGGNDEIIWDAPNGGYDIVDGGGNGDGAGDIDMVTINADGTETAITMYTVAAWSDADGVAPLDPNSEIIITRTVDGVETAIMEIRGIEEVIINGVQGTELINAIGDFTQTSLAPNTIFVNGTAGAEVIDFAGFLSNQRLVVNAGDGDDVITGGAGNDQLLGGAGDDELTWSVGGGNDVIDGGAGEDLYTINGDGSDETFRVYAADAWTGDALAAGTDIVITREADAGEQVIGQLQNIEEIQINTAGGTNDVQVFGDFNPTALNFNTISVTTDGDVSVDVTERLSTHRVFVEAAGTTDATPRSLDVTGVLTEGDVLVIPVDPTTLQTTRDGLMVTQTSGSFTLTYSVDEADTFPVLVQSGTPLAASLRGVPTVNEVTGVPEGLGLRFLERGSVPVTPDDIAALKYMVGASNVLPVLPPEPGEPVDNEPADLLQEVRDLEGLTNNLQNPEISGGATLPFIRVTEARYAGTGGDGAGIVNPVFADLDARDISNVLGAQDTDAAKAASANMFMMSFGQYFDHGLTFIPKGTGPNGPLNQIEIGGPGMEMGPFSDNPADLTRGSVVGYDADGTPLHENITSPVVDQNQVYGSSSLVGQLLRESDGQQGVGSYLVSGDVDPSAPTKALLPTLRELLDHHTQAGTVFTGTDKGDVTLEGYYPDLFNDDGSYNAATVKDLSGDFMGEGWPLLIDTNPFMNLLDHYVGGDGRANENVGLTAVHTVWARNHNFHVEQLEQAGFDGTPEELFQAARILNIGEYQQVVFNDFADSLLGGLQGSGRHGHDEYNPNADGRISHEFAAAAYRFGHSQIGEMMTLKNGAGEDVQVPLFDIFLNPTNDPSVFQADLDRNGTIDVTGAEALDALAGMGYTPQPGFAQYGVSNILSGLLGQPSEEVDLQVVDGVRNDLVRISADLFAFNAARGRDLGLGTLNQVKADLAASANPYVSEAIELSDMTMTPYADWADFQTRNGLSDEMIAKFQQAYPDLVLAGDDLAAFQVVNPDIALIDNGDGSMTVQGIDRVDLWVGGLAESHIQGGVVGHTFWVLIHEQLDRLQEADRFYYIDRIGDLPVYNNFISNITMGDIVARNTGLTDVPLDAFSYNGEPAPQAPAAPQEPAPQEPAPQDPAPQDPAPQEPAPQEPAPQDPAPQDPAPQEPAPQDPAPQDPAPQDPAPQEPAPQEPAQPVEGIVESGTEMGDALVGAAGDDVLSGHDGNDMLVGNAGDDMLFGGDGRDDMLGGDGNDMLVGGAGSDHILGGDGDDMIIGGSGSDILMGNAGDDTFIGTDGDCNDVIYGGEGSDTIDMASVTSELTVRLGNAGTDRGSVTTAEGGRDTIWSIENFVGGSGDDTIFASDAANVLDGGDGNDTFVFETAASAQGDHINGLSAGDVLQFGTGADAVTISSRDQAREAGFAVDHDAANDVSTISGSLDDDTFELTVSGRFDYDQIA
jgi:Ca2+-binding RTX toxin-like protein